MRIPVDQFPTFKVGDRVTWNSQSRGTRCDKTGVVIAIVPADEYPDSSKYGRVLLQNPKTRGYESYIVAVTKSTKRKTKTKPKFFWPRVWTLVTATSEPVPPVGAAVPEPPIEEEAPELVEEPEPLVEVAE